MTFTQIGQIGATGNGSFVDAAYQTFTFNLLPSQISATTTIRFSVGDDVDGNATPTDDATDDIVYVDNINVTYATAAPVQDLTVTYTENGAPVPISVFSQITDPDDTNMESATITLTNRPDGALESLSLNAAATAAVTAWNTAHPGSPLTVTPYVAGTGVLLITGSATKAVYQSILDGVQYNNTDQAPDTANRIINATVFDGNDNSNTATATITVVAVNDAPVVSGVTVNGSGRDLVLDRRPGQHLVYAATRRRRRRSLRQSHARAWQQHAVGANLNRRRPFPARSRSATAPAARRMSLASTSAPALATPATAPLARLAERDVRLRRQRYADR